MHPDPRTGAGPQRAAASWIVAGLTVAGAALRLATIDTRSLWLDETTAVRQASWSISELLTLMAGNVHPPLFHALLHYWIVYFGRSEVAVRSVAGRGGPRCRPSSAWHLRPAP